MKAQHEGALPPPCIVRTARWIKFEEDVEEETERWGKPYVASLSFRSLLELRRTLAHGNAFPMSQLFA